MARLTSIAVQIRIRDSDRHQNLIICSLTHCQPSLKISCKSVQKFLRKVANRQGDRQTDKQRRLHILLGGGNISSLRTNCVHRVFTGEPTDETDVNCEWSVSMSTDNVPSVQPTGRRSCAS